MKSSAQRHEPFVDKCLWSLLSTSILLTFATSCSNEFSFVQTPVVDNQKNRADFTTGNIPTETQAALKKYKPALAVRGAQCMVCHASLQTNIVTDFGYGSSNFASTAIGTTNVFKDLYQVGINGHYTNESAYSNQRDAWQSANEITGSIIIPSFSFSEDQMQTMVGVRQSLTMKQLMEDQTLTGTGSMTSKVTASEKVIEKKSVEISYPTQSEILALIPTSELNSTLLVYKKTLTGESDTVAENFVLDQTKLVVRNDFTNSITCKGDVVIKGTLLLKNAVIETDKKGCRLYVSEGVHIQGTLTVQNTSNSDQPNLQITSPKAILLGFSGDSMGADSVNGATGSRTEITSAVGGRLARFAKRLDTQYNPSGSTINGIASETFFNELTAEAFRLGDYLEDAEDAVLNNHIPTGASSVNGRLSIQYSHLLLNAPHVHSRYYGDIEGAVIAEIAFLARNPAGQSYERFVYDTVFDSAPAVFPAFSRDLLKIKD